MPTSLFFQADQVDAYTGSRARVSVMSGVVPVTITGRTLSTTDWVLGSFQFPASSITLPLRSKFGTLSPVLYVGPDLGRPSVLVALPRLGHSGFVPVAKCTATGDNAYTAEMMTPILPRSYITATHEKLRSADPLNIVQYGSSLIGTAMNEWLTGATPSPFGLTDGGSTVTCYHSAFGGTSPQLAAILIMGRLTGLISANPQLLRNAAPVRGLMAAKANASVPGNPASYISQYADGLVMWEPCANGDSDRWNTVEGTMRWLLNRGIQLVMVTGNGAGETPGEISTGYTYGHGETLIKLCRSLGVPCVDTAAYHLAGVINGTKAQMYLPDDTVHPSNGTNPKGGSWPEFGTEAYVAGLKSVILPAAALEYQAAVRNQVLNAPKIPGAIDVFADANIPTKTGTVTRTAPRRDVSALPSHLLNQFGIVNTVKLAAAADVSVGHLCPISICGVFQGSTDDAVAVPSGGTAAPAVTIGGGASATIFSELWKKANFNDPPQLTGQYKYLLNQGPGDLDICALAAFSPYYEEVPYETFGTWLDSVLNGVANYRYTGTENDYIAFQHPGCRSIIVTVVAGGTSGASVLSLWWDGVAGSDVTLTGTGGYPGYPLPKTFTEFGEHNGRIMLKTVAAGPPTHPFRVGSVFAFRDR